MNFYTYINMQKKWRYVSMDYPGDVFVFTIKAERYFTTRQNRFLPAYLSVKKSKVFSMNVDNTAIIDHKFLNK